MAEAALAVLLLIGSGLLIRSFVSLVQVDAGYTAENVLLASVFLPGGTGAPGGRPQPGAFARTAAFADGLLTRLQQVPGVSAAAAGNMVPLGGAMAISAFDLPGMVNADGSPVIVRASDFTVTPGYLDALGLRLREGRWLTEADRTSAMKALVVNESFVRAYLSDGKPVVGRRFEGLERGVTTEIVGVVGDMLLGGLDTQSQPATYWAVSDAHPLRGRMFLLVRTTGDPTAIVPTLRTLVRESDPGAALDAVGPLAARVAASVSQPRFAAAVLGTLAALAVVLAAVGLYGVLSYNVSRRQREIGVRAALGASRPQILRLIVRQGLGVTLAGLAIGVAGAVALTRLMQQMLFGVTPLDWITFSAAPLLLLLVAVVACLVPARRAATTDPAVALRYE
jgi:predicted permease